MKTRKWKWGMNIGGTLHYTFIILSLFQFKQLTAHQRRSTILICDGHGHQSLVVQFILQHFYAIQSAPASCRKSCIYFDCSTFLLGFHFLVIIHSAFGIYVFPVACDRNATNRQHLRHLSPWIYFAHIICDLHRGTIHHSRIYNIIYSPVERTYGELSLAKWQIAAWINFAFSFRRVIAIVHWSKRCVMNLAIYCLERDSKFTISANYFYWHDMTVQGIQNSILQFRDV